MTETDQIDGVVNELGELAFTGADVPTLLRRIQSSLDVRRGTSRRVECPKNLTTLARQIINRRPWRSGTPGPAVMD